MNRKERAEAGARGESKGSSGGKGTGDSMFSSDASSGLKVSAKGVLMMSLAFISIVVLLHFIDKLGN